MENQKHEAKIEAVLQELNFETRNFNRLLDEGCEREAYNQLYSVRGILQTLRTLEGITSRTVYNGDKIEKLILNNDDGSFLASLQYPRGAK